MRSHHPRTLWTDHGTKTPDHRVYLYKDITIPIICQVKHGILGKTVLNNSKKADAIVNGSFHSGTFSDRIWQYQDLMREDLGKLLQQGLIQGKGARALTKDLRKYLVGDKQGKGATYNVERLMRTELARVQTEAQKQSFIRNGFDMYEFICNHHASKHNTCPICLGLDGKHFKVEDMMPGENAPPMHPNCRCSTAAREDDAENEAWLDHLDKGGTTEEWNKSARAEWEKSQKSAFNNGSKKPIVSGEKKTAKKVLENSEKTSTIKAEMTEVDQKAILDYMSARSYIINEKLRTKAELDEEDHRFINALDVALKNAPKFSGNLTRSLFFNSPEEVTTFIKDYQIGNKVTYREFLSTTKGQSLYNPDGQVQIYIKNAQNGRDISLLNPREEEVLYERGASFIVENIVEKDGKYYILVVENNE